MYTVQFYTLFGPGMFKLIFVEIFIFFKYAIVGKPYLNL